MASELGARDQNPESARTRRGWRVSMEGIATILMIVASALLIVLVLKALLAPARATTAGRPTRPLPAEKVDLTGAILKGSPMARVVMIMYSEFQCPFCARFDREILPTLVREFVDTGKVQIAFRHLPMERIHPFALRAAEGAECANQQGQFWPMQDALFADQTKLDESRLFELARQVGLQNTSFAACMATVTPDRIRNDAAGASSLQISGTPTFLIGLKTSDQRVRAVYRIDGARPLEEFRQALVRATR